jgi:hypothetical protein
MNCTIVCPNRWGLFQAVELQWRARMRDARKSGFLACHTLPSRSIQRKTLYLSSLLLISAPGPVADIRSERRSFRFLG